jgi:hypothetical protein
LLIFSLCFHFFHVLSFLSYPLSLFYRKALSTQHRVYKHNHNSNCFLNLIERLKMVRSLWAFLSLALGSVGISASGCTSAATPWASSEASRAHAAATTASASWHGHPAHKLHHHGNWVSTTPPIKGHSTSAPASRHILALRHDSELTASEQGFIQVLRFDSTLLVGKFNIRNSRRMKRLRKI